MRVDHYPGLVTDAAEVARRCAETMYAKDNVAQDLAMEIAEIAPGRARLRMTVADSMVNGFGIAHGGYVFLLADTAFAYACNSYGPVTVAAGADITFVAPAHLGDQLVATAEERVRYGRSGIYDVTVRREGPDGGTVIAEFRGRSRVLTQNGRPGTANGN